MTQCEPGYPGPAIKQKNMNVLLNDEIIKVLNARRIPARLNAAQVGVILGFSPYDITVLITKKFLRPLGKPAQYSTKWFAAKEIEAMSGDVT
jgi:hypothetical protein